MLNVVDVEATCWRGASPRDQTSEIIEIGLCVVDLVGRRRVARDRILVRPVRSRVSAFCTELTGLTQAEVDDGVSLAEACALLADRHQANTRAWASWGDYDRRQFERQCASAEVPYPFGDRHINAKAVFAQAYDLQRQMGMASALRHVDLPLEGRHHNGADDAWNIGALVLHTLAAGAWPGAWPLPRDAFHYSEVTYGVVT